MPEYEIVLQLLAPKNVDDGTLEEQMLAILSVVEDHAKDVALGPVVAVDLSKRLIDLGFCVAAESLEEANNGVAQVLRVIEEHTEVSFTPTSASSNIVTSPDDCSLAMV